MLPARLLRSAPTSRSGRPQVVFDTQNLAIVLRDATLADHADARLNTLAGANALCSLNTAGVWAAASVVLSPLVAIPF